MKIGWDDNSRTTVRTFIENAVAARNRQIELERAEPVDQNSLDRPQHAPLTGTQSSDSSESRTAALMH